MEKEEQVNDKVIVGHTFDKPTINHLKRKAFLQEERTSGCFIMIKLGILNIISNSMIVEIVHQMFKRVRSITVLKVERSL